MRDPTPYEPAELAAAPHRRLAAMVPRSVGGKLQFVFVVLLAMAALNLGVSRWTTTTLESHADEIRSAFHLQGILWETFGRLDGVRRDVSRVAERGEAPSDSLLAVIDGHRRALHERLGQGAAEALPENAPRFLGLRALTDSAVTAWQASLDAPTANARARLRDRYTRQAQAIFGDLFPAGLRFEERRLRRAQEAFEDAAVFGSRLTWLIFVASSAIAGLVLTTLMRRLGVRLRVLEEAATRMGGGDLSHKVPADSSDELGDVARAFNAMGGRLSAALAELERSEFRFRQFFENANDPLFLHDADGRLVAVNRGACESLGYDRDELLAMNVQDFARTFDTNSMAELWERMAPGEVMGFEGVHRRRDGTEFPVDIKVRLFDVDGRSLMLADVRDLTQRRELEEQLIHASKLEAVGRLAGGIAHDFNNVLTVIRGHCQLVMSETDASAPHHEEIEEIDRSARRAAKLVKHLLAFSRQQVLEPAVVSPGEVAHSMQLMLERLIDEDIELLILVDEGLGNVRVDTGQLEQVILNLVINARDAMPVGGRLRISLRNDRITRHQAAQSRVPLEPGPYVCLSVDDTGTGIPPDVLPHIFDPFFTTKEVGKGSGLGLASVYGIVTQSGGHVGIRSEPGKGTRVDVRLPSVEDSVAVHGSIEERSGDGPVELLKGRTVLVVEDERPVQKVIQRVLERSGCNVVSAEDGVAALLLFEEMADCVDLVITDVVMPRLGGAGLAESIAAERADLPILFVSGYTRDEMKTRGAGEHILTKPFTPDDLVQEVCHALMPEGRLSLQAQT